MVNYHFLLDLMSQIHCSPITRFLHFRVTNHMTSLP